MTIQAILHPQNDQISESELKALVLEGRIFEVRSSHDLSVGFDDCITMHQFQDVLGKCPLYDEDGEIVVEESQIPPNVFYDVLTHYAEEYEEIKDLERIKAFQTFNRSPFRTLAIREDIHFWPITIKEN